jgi:hypothetical protein
MPACGRAANRQMSGWWPGGSRNWPQERELRAAPRRSRVVGTARASYIVINRRRVRHPHRVFSHFRNRHARRPTRWPGPEPANLPEDGWSVGPEGGEITIVSDLRRVRARLRGEKPGEVDSLMNGTLQRIVGPAIDVYGPRTSDSRAPTPRSLPGGSSKPQPYRELWVERFHRRAFLVRRDVPDF